MSFFMPLKYNLIESCFSCQTINASVRTWILWSVTCKRWATTIRSMTLARTQNAAPNAAMTMTTTWTNTSADLKCKREQNDGECSELRILISCLEQRHGPNDVILDFPLTVHFKWRIHCLTRNEASYVPLLFIFLYFEFGYIVQILYQNPHRPLADESVARIAFLCPTQLHFMGNITWISNNITGQEKHLMYI